MISKYLDSKAKGATLPDIYIKVEFYDEINWFLPPANDNAPFWIHAACDST